MYKTFHTVILTAALCLVSTLAAGQDSYLGVFNSLKGFGLSASFASRDSWELDNFYVMADTYGLYSGRTQEPGIRIRYTHDYLIWDYYDDYFLLNLYAGAGASAGYVHDYEKGFFSYYDSELEQMSGFALALVGKISARFFFPDRHIVLDIGFSAAPGIHIKTDSPRSAYYTSIYKNGIFQALFPEATIFYRF